MAIPSTASTETNILKGILPLKGIVDPQVQLWSGRRTRSQELKSLHESDWIQYWDWYRNEIEPLDDAADWWRSNEPIPTVFKIIETILPRLVMGMFDSPDWFYVEARNARSEIYETMCYNLLRQMLEGMELFPKIYQALRYSLIMGHAWGKVIWREEYQNRKVLQPLMMTNRQLINEQFGQQGVDEALEMYGEDLLDAPSGVTAMNEEVVTEEVYNAPDFEWRSLDRIFPDPTGRGRWFIEEIDTTLEELQDVQRDLQIYDQNVLDMLENEVTFKANVTSGGLDTLGDARSGTSAGVSVEYLREPESTEHIPEHIISPMRDGSGVKLWQCWGWVPPSYRVNDVENVLVIIAEGKYILRNDACPTPDGKPPYFPIKSIDIPTRLYGESILRYVGPLADQQTRLANMRLDEVFLGVWQQYLFRKNAVVSDNKLLMQPGGAIEVDPAPNQTIRDTFEVLPRKPLLPQVWQEDTYRQVQAEHVAASTDIMQGVQGSDRTTATEIERRLQQGNARHVLQVMYNDYTVKRELLQRVWQWLQMRLTTPRLVQLQGEEFAQVDLNDIQVPIDIVVSGGLFALSKQNRVQMDQELIQLVSSPLFANYFKPVPVLRKWMQDRGWKNPETFLKTEQELYQEEYQRGLNEGQAMVNQAETQAQMSNQPTNGARNIPRMSQMSNAGQENSMAGGILEQS